MDKKFGMYGSKSADNSYIDIDNEDGWYYDFFTRERIPYKKGIQSIMDNNDWAKQYIESVDRNISEIRKESNENRREIKSDIHDYINAVNKKIDDSVEESRNMRLEIKNELNELKSEFQETKNETIQTRRHVNNMMITMIIGLAGIFLAVAAIVVAVIFNGSP